MELSMPVVWSDRCVLHEPAAEIWVGVPGPAAETPARARAILDALDVRMVDAEPHPDEALLAVHDQELLAYLASAWEEWSAAELPQEQVVPYVFAHRELGARRAATAVWARPGWFAYDTMTLVGPGTWEAACGAADAALTAVDLVLAGEPAAYACTRPPGHQVTRSVYGGSCYLNNAAVAAAAFAEGGPVAVLDVDAHHGNGTQEIFRGRGEVRTGSVHVDPAAGWFPHFLGGGLGVLMITHDLSTAARLADRIAVMYLGRIVEEGPAAQVVDDPQRPYTKALLWVVPRRDPRERSRPQILRGEAPDAVRIPPGCRFHPRCPIAVEDCRAIDPPLEPAGSGAGHRTACILAG